MFKARTRRRTQQHIGTESKRTPQGAPNLTARAFGQIAGRRSGYRQKRSPAYRIRREICD